MLKELFVRDAAVLTIEDEADVKPASPTAQEVAQAAERVYQQRQAELEVAKKALLELEEPGGFSLRAIMARETVIEAQRLLMQADRAREVAVDAMRKATLRDRHAGLAVLVKKQSDALEVARQVAGEILAYSDATVAVVGSPRYVPVAVFPPIAPNNSESADLDLWRQAMRREGLLT